MARKPAAKRGGAKKAVAKKRAAGKAAASKKEASVTSSRLKFTGGVPDLESLRFPTVRGFGAVVEGSPAKGTRKGGIVAGAAATAPTVPPPAYPNLSLPADVEKRLKQVLKSEAHKLAGNSDVISVGYGLKVTNGAITATPCILVTVGTKIDDLESIPVSRRLPKTLGGFEVDVVSMHGTLQSKPVFAGGFPNNWTTGAHAPDGGTLGAIVFRDHLGNRYPCGLSNVHVWGNWSNYGVRWPVGTVDEQQIGKVADFDQNLDACLAVLDANVQYNSSLVVSGLGFAIAGHTNPTIGSMVVKSGAKTGVTYGIVQGQTSPGNFRVHYLPAPGDAGQISDGGDSGSVVVEFASRLAVGLLFGTYDGVSGVPLAPTQPGIDSFSMYAMPAIANSLAFQFTP